MATGKVYMIPIPIAEGTLHTLAPEIPQCTLELRHYFVENLRTARRFLKSLHPSLVIDNISFSEIDKHNGADLATFRTWLKEGYDIGIMSEAGCPGIADPGAELAAIAQQMGATIVPLTGPSSIILALMASGLNGQSFCFNGYLPVKEPARSQRIKALEQISKKENQTQLFIETPYRNNVILEDLLKNCMPSTRLCIAVNITAADAYIKTKKVADWKTNKPVLEKLPAVFLLLA
ncbi:MAG: SAM-dependent methyltransferase [Bacteroidetes bacterium]|nr:SAM-dependent methyltransferase [Bacteroidota bacterium]